MMRHCFHAVSLLFVLWSGAVCPAALVGYYTFDDGLDLGADSSAFANDGSTLAGTPTQDTVNFVAGTGALSLNGSSALEINAIANDVLNTTHSMSVWIRTAATDRPTFLSVNTSTGGNKHLFFITTGANATAQIFSDPPGSFIAIAGAPVVNDNTFHHVAWVRNGSSGELYVDGVLRSTVNPGYSYLASDKWSIGQEFDDSSTGDFWNGQIDDLQIYDTPLSSTDVSFLYNNPGMTAGAVIPEPDTAILMVIAFILVSLCSLRRSVN